MHDTNPPYSLNRVFMFPGLNGCKIGRLLPPHVSFSEIYLADLDKIHTVLLHQMLLNRFNLGSLTSDTMTISYEAQIKVNRLSKRPPIIQRPIQDAKCILVLCAL
jgi:hypothetical protein